MVDITDTDLILLPSHLAQSPKYSASNVTEWIKLDKFRDYIGLFASESPKTTI
jgi:hypothetical protein